MSDEERAAGADDTFLDRGVGEQDHLQRLWTPYRMSYVSEVVKRDTDEPEQPFTDIPRLPDDDGLVVARGELVYAVLNLYPYNPGHLMVVPYRRVSELEDLTNAESAELMAFHPEGDSRHQERVAAAWLQRRRELGDLGGRVIGRAPACARRAALGWRRELHHRRRRLEGDTAVAARDSPTAGQRVGEAAVSKAPFLSRAAFARLTTPTARAMLRIGLTPDAVTILGTTASVAGALTLFPLGKLFPGACVVCFFVVFDMLDGAMARERGGGTRFGAVLDATCDRISDGAVFCGLLWWAAFGLHDKLLVVATLICLVTSQVTSYIKARAEASRLCGDGGLIERPERLIIVLTGAGVSDFPFIAWPPALPVAMWLLAVAGVITCGQRLYAVRTSPRAGDPMAGTGDP